MAPESHYELIAHQWDQPDGEDTVWSAAEERHIKRPRYARRRKGDIVTLNLDDTRRLYKCGAVRTLAERDQAAALQGARAALAVEEQRILTGQAPARDSAAPQR